MCTQPITLRRDYRKESGIKCGSLEPLPTVRCGRCAECKAEKIDDWIGRALAEAEDCRQANVFTFTYGRDKSGRVNHQASMTLDYEHVKLLWKKLRGAGHGIRYIVAGQYGDKFGRAHFHAIIYWQGRGPMKGDSKLSEEELNQQRRDYKVPDMTLRTHKIDWVRPTKTGRYDTWWDHGFTYIDDCHGKAVRYVARYVTREDDAEHKRALFYTSSRPPIGGKYVARRASDLVDAGLAPQDGNYSPMGSEFEKPRGKQRCYQYRMFGATKRLFVNTFEELWYARRGPLAGRPQDQQHNGLAEQELPFSPWLDKAINDIQKHEARRLRERKSEQERIFNENLQESRLKTKEAAERKAAFVAEQIRKRRGPLLWPSEVNTPARPRVNLDNYVEVDDEAVAKAKLELARREREAYWKAHREAELYRLAGDFPSILVKPVEPEPVKAPKDLRLARYPSPPSSGYRLAAHSGAKGLLGRPLREPSPGEVYRRQKAAAGPPRRDASGRRINRGMSLEDYMRSD